MYHRTLFNTPVVFHIFYAIAWLGLRIAGWKIKGRPPDLAKYIVIAYPHTSNWDFPLGVAVSILFRIKIYWLGKESLFKGVAGPVMKWLGGKPIDRSEAHDVVQQTINTFEQNDAMIVAVAPEGTRSQVGKWKTGFYHIAVGANLPIILGYFDYAKKQAGCLESFTPTGNIDQDMISIKTAYQGVEGKYNNQAG